MGLFDELFGGTDSSAQDATLNQNAAILEKQSQLSERARQDIANIFPSAQSSLGTAVNKALELTGKSTHAQMDAFQQGNQAAQKLQALGLGAFQNAILGTPQDLSAETLLKTLAGVSPGISVNTDFLAQAAPQVADPATLGLRLDPDVLDLPTVDRSVNNGVGTDQQIAAIQAIANAFSGGSISKGQGAKQVAETANSMGMDLGQLSSILGMTPETVLRVLTDHNQRLDNVGDSRTAAIDSPRASPQDQISAIASRFSSGDIGLREGTEDILNLGRQAGMNANQIASLIGVPTGEVLAMANRFGLSI